MNHLTKIIFILLLVMAFQFANGQKTNWSLQNCIDVGIENNIGIKIQKLEVNRTEKSRVSMINELLPTVSLFGSQSYNFGSTIDPSTNGRVSSNIQYDNFYMNAQINLIDFGAIANSQKSKIAINLAKADLEIIENEYKLQILTQFYETLFTQELQKIQKQQLENTRLNLIRVSKEIEIGSKPKSDLYDIQFEYSKEENQLLETQQLFEIQKINLFQLINYDEKINHNIIFINDIENKYDTSEIILNPKIKSAELSSKISEKELRIQRSKMYPTLTTFYQLSSFYYRPINDADLLLSNFSDQLGNNKNQQVGLQLSVPIFNGFKNNKAINAAKIESEKSNLKVEQQKILIEQQVEIEKVNIVHFLLFEEKLADVLLFAEASFKTTQAKFTSGSVDSFSFSIAKNNLLTSTYNVLKNKLQHQYTVHKINLIRTNSL
ncbi:TolC family protein [Flavobacterium antarcticum]|uniref:TolC family protein n=1 Tax=Flavobacterium antarcticum TaxID=271155 RepID=UPI00041C37EA|nr:TolC family protein [Flavobacterium antarcticum]